ncbi:MAG: hypothetical protein BWX52_01980 [Bacteroidetes bacterium ADurb.Bin013]|nr:MAG: hypothetical protein BWX52_01980 [Bacteroidetes bacterium ADurb.Bin013]
MAQDNSGGQKMRNRMTHQEQKMKINRRNQNRRPFRFLRQ